MDAEEVPLGGRESECPKKKQLRTGRVSIFGIKCNYGTDDPLCLSVFALAFRATW